ncbi:MAG: mechanosensitive ion channel [Desulfobulbaceae bacterium]|nr:mechanosensitive ion channel [Desulfobulbaceae bacterium]
MLAAADWLHRPVRSLERLPFSSIEKLTTIMLRSRRPDNLSLIICCLILCWLALPMGAQAMEEEFNPSLAGRQLDHMERSLARHQTGFDELPEQLRQSKEFLHEAEQCLTDGEAELAAVAGAIVTLGPELKGESRAVNQERAKLLHRRAAAEKRMGDCRLLAMKSKAMQEALTAFQRQKLAQRLLHREADIGAVLSDAADKVMHWRADTSRFLRQHSGVEPLTGGFALILVALLMAGGLAVGIWARLRPAGEAAAPPAPLPGIFESLLLTFRAALIWLLPLLTLTVAATILGQELTPPPYLPPLLIGLTVVVLARLTSKAFLLPPPHLAAVVAWPHPARRRLLRRLQGLFLVGLAAFLLLFSPLADELAESAYQLCHTVVVTLFCLLFLRLCLCLTRLAGDGRRTAAIRSLVILLLTATTAAEWLGYRNFALYLSRGLIGTTLLAALMWGANALLCRLFYAMAYGRQGWQCREKDATALGKKEASHSVAWARALTAILCWSIFAVLLLRVWRVSDAFVNTIFTFLGKGFSAGNFTLIPVRIISGLLLFTVLWTLSSWLRVRLEKEWLIHTQLEEGAREAVVTVSGYIGFTLATIFGLATAGFDFTSLAVIAGALSVGIGFGLQNIVNNFVSGLILLFERPITKGDWVKVGTTEGFVQKISVRSTIIQTFDRADVIVPNSDLIATPVTNLMLQDRFGRVKAAVGVAYGSDTGLVKRLLEELAAVHPQVIGDGSVPLPRAYFTAFGDSSLNFELRCFIHDISQIFEVRSDLNFAIDAAFRAHGITIPFPQRDLHIIDMPKERHPPETSRPGAD